MFYGYLRQLIFLSSSPSRQLWVSSLTRLILQGAPFFMNAINFWKKSEYIRLTSFEYSKFGKFIFLRAFFVILKRATKFHKFVRINLCVVIVFFITDLYKSAFSTYSFITTSFLSFYVPCLLSVFFLWTRSYIYRFFITFL